MSSKRTLGTNNRTDDIGVCPLLVMYNSSPSTCLWWCVSVDSEIELNFPQYVFTEYRFQKFRERCPMMLKPDDDRLDINEINEHIYTNIQTGWMLYDEQWRNAPARLPGIIYLSSSST